MALLELTSYRAGLRQMLLTVWPEVNPASGGGAIWTVPRVQQTGFDDWVITLLNATAADNLVTAAFVQPEASQASEEWGGITNQAYLVATHFHYVRRRDSETDLEEFVERQLLQLEEYLWTTGPPLGQCLDVESIDVTEAGPINRILLEKNMAFFGGTLTASMLVGHGSQ